MGFFGDLLGGLVDVGGSLLGDIGGALWNQKETGRMKHWQEKMRATAHQTQVADLKAAGLNPILSAGGSGAAMPGAISPPNPNFGKSITSGMATAAQVRQARATTALTTAEAKSRALQTNYQSDAYKWLEKNPQFKSLLYSARLAKDNGLNPSLFGPMLTSNSASAKSWVDKMVDAVFGDKAVELHHKGVNAVTRKQLKAWKKDLNQINKEHDAGYINQDGFWRLQD